MWSSNVATGLAAVARPSRSSSFAPAARHANASESAFHHARSTVGAAAAPTPTAPGNGAGARTTPSTTGKRWNTERSTAACCSPAHAQQRRVPRIELRLVENRQREAVRPHDHERVALEHLAQSALQRVVDALPAREPAARGVRDRPLARDAGRAEEDELGGKIGRLPRWKLAALHPGDDRVVREATEPEARRRELAVREQGEPRGLDGFRQIACGRHDEPLVRNEGGRVPLDGLAHRRGRRLGPRTAGATDSAQVVELDAEQPGLRSDLACRLEEPRLRRSTRGTPRPLARCPRTARRRA